MFIYRFLPPFYSPNEIFPIIFLSMFVKICAINFKRLVYLAISILSDNKTLKCVNK